MKASKAHPAAPAADLAATSTQDVRNDDAQGDASEADASATSVVSIPDTGQGRSKDAEKAPKQKPGEVGGPKGPEPTRYGDWEVGGRCTDF